MIDVIPIKEKRKLFRSSAPVEIVLFVINQCNGCCPYCFVDRSPANVRLLEPEDLQNFLNRVEEYTIPSQPITLYWQGAEATNAPLAYWIEYAKIVRKFAKTRRVQSSLVTGMFNNIETLLDVIREFPLDSIAFTVDPTRGADVVERIEGKLQRCRDELKRLGRSEDVVTQAALITLTTKLVGREHELLDKYVTQLGLDRIRLRELVPVERADAAVIPSPAELTSIFKAFCDAWFSYDGWLRVEPLSSFLAAQLVGKPSGTCMFFDGCANLLSMQPGGRVSACDISGEISDEMSFGILTDDNSWKQIVNAANVWRSRSPAECQKCPMLPACHGGCPARAFVVNGSIHRKDPYCEVFLEVQKYIITRFRELPEVSQERMKQSLQRLAVTKPALALV